MRSSSDHSGCTYSRSLGAFSIQSCCSPPYSTHPHCDPAHCPGLRARPTPGVLGSHSLVLFSPLCPLLVPPVFGFCSF